MYNLSEYVNRCISNIHISTGDSGDTGPFLHPVVWCPQLDRTSGGSQLGSLLCLKMDVELMSEYSVSWVGSVPV